MNLNQITLPAADFDRSVAFYRDMGFLLIVHSPPRYARFECPKGDATFSLHTVNHGRGDTGVVVYFECADLDARVDRLLAAGFVFTQLPRDEPWLWREARLSDPFGNVLCLFQAGCNRRHPPWRIAPRQTDPLLIREVSATDVPMELLLLADPSERMVRSCLIGSRCFVACIDDAVIGACVVQPREPGAHELMNIAVQPAHQKSGHGTALLKWVLECFRESGARQMEVGTGTFGHQLAFYQRQGFRVAGIDQDFFTRNYPEPIFENGIQHIDMLRLVLRYSQ